MQIDWYFDFISPYAYLQWSRLLELTAGHELRLRPILLAGLLNHWGQRGPAEIPPKRVFTYLQVLWQARTQGVPLVLPDSHPFNSLKLLRLAIHFQCRPEVVQRLFEFVWRDGHTPQNAGAWNALIRELSVPDADEVIGRQEIKDALKANTDEAIEAGVFGVPTLMMGTRPFWGNDATEMAREFLQNPNTFTEDEARIAALPMSAVRRS